MTQIQAAVSGALQELNLEAKGGVPGSPQELTITKESVDFVKGKEGKSLVIQSDGSVTWK